MLVEHQIEPPDAAREHFETVLHSKCFERTNSLRSLLFYLWQNRDNEISEYAIAVDALGRNCDFESKVDATVRVQIGRLRRLLNRYYESEGRPSGKRLVIPLGSHKIFCVDAEPRTEIEPVLEKPAEHDNFLHLSMLSAPPAAQANRFAREYLITLPIVAILVVLITCFALFLLPSFGVGAKTTRLSEKEPPLFWKRLFNNGRPTRIVLPAPLFFAWPKKPDSLMVRDISVNHEGDENTSPQLIALEKRFGKPSQWQNYTVASDTFAALQLARFLDRYGIQTNFSSSADSPDEITNHENIIAFGTASSFQAYRSDLERLSFKLGPLERYVIDLHQPKGSEEQFPVVYESNSRMVTPGIVALLPRGSSGNRILLVQGSQTSALILYLTSEDGMREIMKAADRFKTPFFEAVILSEVSGGDSIQSRLAAFRPFTVPVTDVQKPLISQSASPAR